MFKMNCHFLKGELEHMGEGELIQGLIYGLTMGSIYALVALGITMVFAAMSVLNFAHADVLMIGTFICLTLIRNVNIPYIFAVVISLGVSYLIGVLMATGVFKPMGDASTLVMLLATIGISTVLRNLALIIWGAETRSFPTIFPTELLYFGNLIIVPRDIYTIIVAVLIVMGLRLFFMRTRTGKAMRAANNDRYAARLMGINTNLTTSLSFGISAILGTMAGILLAPFMFVSFNMAPSIVLKAFAASVIGGLGNFYGAILGGLLLGIIENFVSRFISSAYRDAISYGILIIILLWKPKGFFGERGGGGN